MSEDFEQRDGQDVFLRQRPQRPKERIAEYVEQSGVEIPRIFPSLETALDFVKEGGGIMLRSEHPQDYAGTSGLLRSYKIDPDTVAKALNIKDTSIDWKRYNPIFLSDPRGK